MSVVPIPYVPNQNVYNVLRNALNIITKMQQGIEHETKYFSLVI